MNSVHLFGVEILYPQAVWWIALAPFVFAVTLWGWRARTRDRERLIAAHLQPRVLGGYSKNRALARVLLACSATVLIAIALLGPVSGFSLRDVQRKGLDLVLCVDTSRSMLVQDLKPDRLTRARREVVGLLGKLQGDRAAILAFSGDVRDVAPLTHDRKTLEIFVDTLSPEDNMRGGTDIGAVLRRALDLFDGRTGAHEAIVLLTDGEDLEGQGLEIAQTAKERGIRIYIVGMATEPGGKIPDGARGFVRDEAGQEVVSKLGRESLSAIADATGGVFITADSSPTPLEELHEKRISKLEGRQLFAGKERIPHDRFQWPLALAALCMLVETGLRERRGRDVPAALRSVHTKEAA
ncbi:MAG: VWA domain-containing protein [Planctomycetes bacterium]|nr:VWA domain-containing protein [Planctomycetota bacterium]